MDKRKTLVVYFSTVIGLILVFGLVLLFLILRSNDEAVVNKINNADYIQIVYPIESPPTDPKEANEVNVFFSTLTSCFFENNVNAFNCLLRDEQIPWVTLSQADKCCSSFYSYPSDTSKNTYIKNGKLYEVSTEADPPEIETGLSASLFSENLVPAFRESVTRTGFIEYANWFDANAEYINEYFYSIYDELAWTVEIAPDKNGSASWSIYKLSNNTYLITNGFGWYSKKTFTREFSGKVFVVKKLNDELYDNELKIVAFIDVQ